MQSIDNKLFNIIKGTGKGYVFSGADFIDKFAGDNIDKALSTLAKENKIRRIMRGIYDFPKYSELLGQYLSPEIDKVAHALARKFKWRIEPSRDTALYLLGLSTQVPARYAYFSDGPKREYDILGNQLEFKKIALKNIGFKYAESALLVQAIKSFGKDNGGSIPPNLLQIPNSEATSLYLRRCKQIGIKAHPARFPSKLPEFFIKMLTDEGDLVVDIFGGSNTTGYVAEQLNRRWKSFELSNEYVAASTLRFLPDSSTEEDLKETYENVLQGQSVSLNDPTAF